MKFYLPFFQIVYKRFNNTTNELQEKENDVRREQQMSNVSVITSMYEPKTF
jgi:hypothetical protein